MGRERGRGMGISGELREEEREGDIGEGGLEGGGEERESIQG